MAKVTRSWLVALLVAVALLACALVVGITASWATGIGTDVHGRPCLTHWTHVKGCH